MIVKSITDFETSWEEIKAASDAGRLGELLHHGDEIDVPLKNGECLTLEVKKDIVGNFFYVSRQYINTDTRMDEFFALLPDDLQAVIKPTNFIKFIHGEKVEVQDKLFLFTNGNFIENLGKGRENGLNLDEVREGMLKYKLFRDCDRFYSEKHWLHRKTK